MEYQRNCENPACQKPFTAKRRDHRFCCDSCRTATWMRKPGVQTVKNVITDMTADGTMVSRAEFDELNQRVDELRGEMSELRSSVDNLTGSIQELSGFFSLWLEAQRKTGTATRPLASAEPEPLPEIEVKQAAVTPKDLASRDNFFKSMMVLQEAAV